MPKYYTVEKAKYGGVTGTIQPFTMQLEDANTPETGRWRTYLPAGFLRCDGSVLKANQYPVLSVVIGVGKLCKFAQQELLDDEFQLPDLGSKYIRASNSSGQYLNTTLNQDSTISKIGTETQVQSLVGDSTTISYSGDFEVLGISQTPFGGNPIYTTQTGYTSNSQLDESNFQAHGHDSDTGVFTYLAKWKDTGYTGNGGTGANDAQTEGANMLVQISPPEGSSPVISHNHQIVLPNTAALKANTDFAYTFLNTRFPAQGLQSTVTITTEDVKKLDEAISPYIVMEYIIKI